MKVVLFCGGLGLRLGGGGGDGDQRVPKPMTRIGYRPILWHLMRYYASYGHTDFVLCLGYKADVVKDYFLRYDECLSNDFVLTGGGPTGGRRVRLLGRDIDDWTITFVDTGLHASVGERLRAVEPHLAGEDAFLANYSDGLSDLDLDRHVDDALSSGKVATFLAVRPPQSFHVVGMRSDGTVTGIEPVDESETWINGGFFVFRRAIFDHLGPGEDLVEAPFARLITRGELRAAPYRGFWRPMDTFKDRQVLEDLHARDDAPWEVWRRPQKRTQATATPLRPPLADALTA